jgi:uncharacterized membrane protein YccC
MRGALNSKTMWLAIALAILGAAYDNFSYVENIIQPRFYGILLIAIGASVAVLRVLTTLPLDEK